MPANSVKPETRTAIILRVFNVLVTVIALTINVLSTVLPLNGVRPNQISDKYFTYITPAGFAFSIWGLIYFFIALFTVYQCFPKTFESKAINNGIGIFWILNGLLNGAWLFTWHYEVIWLSVILMGGIFVTLLVIVVRLHLKYRPADTWIQYFCVHFPWSIYLGWIINAFIINIFCLTTNATDPAYINAAVVGLVVAATVESVLGIWLQDPAFPAVGSWATAAIAANSMIVGADLVLKVAMIASILLGCLTLLILIWNGITAYRKKNYSNLA